MNKEFNNRIEWISNLTKFIPNGVGVEIGTFAGEFAKEILQNWPGKLYMVDVWRKLGSEYDDACSWNKPEEQYGQVMANTAGYEDRAIMIRAASADAISLFPDESLDFIYIDANHAYEFVKQDLELWFPKLKKGGIFSGHDYLNFKPSWYDDPNFCSNGKDKYIYLEGGYAGVFGVNPAVDEFCEANSYSILKTKEWVGTWWFIK